MIYILAIFSFILGACISSFCGVVIYRVPNKISIIKPNSYCPNCKNSIKWYDNIPIISYIILRGRCRYCKEKIGLNSFLLELLGGILYLLIFLAYGISIYTILYMLISIILIIIFGIDYNTYSIYDFSLIIFGILSIITIVYISISNMIVPYNNFIGLASGFIFFYLIRVISKLIYKREALGMGDVLLMTVAGLLLGWQKLLLSILIGSVAGSIISIILIITHVKNKEDAIAFGPYLILGILVAMLYGDNIINFYLGLVI